MRENHKDNDERTVGEKSPCCFCYEFTKDDIDKPPFEEE